jgi:hypothetical protein
MRGIGFQTAGHMGLFALSVAALGGCTNFGAQRLGIDRSDYANHLRNANKEQLLLNIVALRYGDAPSFLEVSSVISQYSREGQLNAQAHIGPDSDGTVGGSVILRETPTITYTPLSGDRFARSILTPIQPASLLAMIEAGWSVDLLFELAVRSLNGVSSGGRDELFASAADPEFDRAIEALGRLQRSRKLVVHVEHGEGNKFTVTALISKDLSASEHADVEYLYKVLKLPGDRKGDVPVVFRSATSGERQLVIGTRSMFEILPEMAQGVELPPAEAARAMPTSALASGRPPLVRIHSGTSKPEGAHVVTKHNGLWFWIDAQDAQSKRMFLMAQILLSLNDTSGGANAPVVTIPTG